MCRKSQLHGWSLIALGAGILIGGRFGCDFFVVCAAIGIILFGISTLFKK